MQLPNKILVLFCFLICSLDIQCQNIDIDILKAINPRHPDAFVWKAASGSIDWVAGTVVFSTLAYGYISGSKETQLNGYQLLIASGINIGTTQLLKVVFNRTRPADKYPDEVFANSVSKDKSFPSGHTSQAFAIATTLTMQYKKWYVTVPAYMWAGCVGYSRMYLGKHYPSDVLAGAAVGVGSSYLSKFLTDKFLRKKKPEIKELP